MEHNTIGSFIASERKAKGMTQKQLAQMLNVSDKAISRWERDESQPDLTLIPVMADIFGVTADELLRGQQLGRQNASRSHRPFPYITKTVISVILGFVGFLTALIFHYSDSTEFWQNDHRLLAFLLAATFCLIAGFFQATSMIRECRRTTDQQETAVNVFLHVCAFLIALLFGTVPILGWHTGIQDMLIYAAALTPNVFCILLRLNWFITKPLISKATPLFQKELRNQEVRALRKWTTIRDLLHLAFLAMVVWTGQSYEIGTVICLFLLILELPLSTLYYLWKKHKLNQGKQQV